MGCSAFGKTGTEAQFPEGVPCGVLQGHAYSIIDVFSVDIEVLDQDDNPVKKREKLLRLRNPWGKKEWNGAWSDGSDELNDNVVALNTYIRATYSPEHDEAYSEQDMQQLLFDGDK